MENLYESLDLRSALEIIESAESALVLCHRNPDGDAVGSSLALCEIFRLLGKRAKAVCDSSTSPHLEFMAGGERLEYTSGLEDEFDAVISVDVASLGQLGELCHLADRVDLMIDHHSSGEPFAPSLIDPNASAAGEIIFKIYETLKEEKKIQSSPVVARLIFAAISSDTGSFKYSNATPETFSIASKLCAEVNGAEDGGMKTDEISRLLHDTVTAKELRAQSILGSQLEFFENGALAVCAVTRKMMELNGIFDEDTSAAVDIPRKIKGVLVAVALKQKRDEPGKFRVSARSNADIDVAEICSAYFGGGGHVRAAGGEVAAKNAKEAVKAVADAFGEAVREYLTEKKGGGEL